VIEQAHGVGCFKPHKFVRAVGHNSAGKHCVFRGGNDYPEILLHEAALELVEIGNIGQALELEWVDYRLDSRIKFHTEVVDALNERLAAAV